MNINDCAVLSRDDVLDTDCGMQDGLWSYQSLWIFASRLYSSFTGRPLVAILTADSKAAQVGTKK